MRYLGASAAALAAAMTVSLSPIGRTARASDDKPVIRSTIERNAILPFSANSSSAIPYTIDPIYYSIERYGPRTLLFDLSSVDNCTEIAEGAWTNITDTRDCGKEKCGKVTTGTVTFPGGPACPGKTFTYAAIYYEWTAHNNQRITDTFSATWTYPSFVGENYTFNITVPVVRPDHEETAFHSWAGPNGQWKQTLVPPSSDPNFDFSGEIVQEFAAGQAGPDTCWFPNSKRSLSKRSPIGPICFGR